MAQFQNMIITRAGLDMIAESQAGGTLIFTKGKLGDGQITDQSIPDLTDLISTKMSVELSTVTAKGNGQVEVRFIVDNTDIDVGFFVREVGIFAKVNDEGVEKLYGYANAGNYTNYLADKTVPIDSIITKIDLAVGNASNIAFTTDKSIVYVTLADLEEAINAHNIDENSHEAAFNKHNADINAHLDMVGATTEAAGKRGMVPQPKAGDQGKALLGNAKWELLIKAITEEAGTITVTKSNGSTTTIKQILKAIQDGDGNNIVDTYATKTQLGVKANTASPTFTGTPTAPTAEKTTDSTQIATTAFVKDVVADYATVSALNAKAPLASPTFTGTPKAPTPVSSDNSTRIATTAFVKTALNNVNYGGAMPNYSAAVTLNVQTYTAPSNGWVRCNGVDYDDNGWYAHVNNVGVIYAWDHASGPNWQDFILPVYKGDVVTTGNNRVIAFYPCRG